MNIDSLYSFVFKGVLTDEALDKTERIKRSALGSEEFKKLSETLGIEELDEEFVTRAKKWQLSTQLFAPLKIL